MSKKLSKFQNTLSTEGVARSLEVLNEGIPHRYTGIFRLDGDILNNVYLFDKLDEIKPEALERVPLNDSFCQMVLKEGFFLSDNSSIDRRLDYSPYQGMVIAYHGVPIESKSGGLYGTLCHFDLVERSISDQEFDLLRKAAFHLPSYLAYKD